MPTHHYTHITSSPLYTNPTHTIERLSRSSWQITSPLLPSPILAKTYAEAKQLASEIDFNALSTKAAEPAPIATVEAAAVIDSAAVEAVDVNPFEAILTEAATITDLGTMQPAYDKAVRECDLCAVLGHLSSEPKHKHLRDRCFDAVCDARAKVQDDARALEVAWLLGVVTERTQDGIAAAIAGDMEWAVVCLCDMPDGFVKMALIRWAVTCGSWPARLRLEGAALRHAQVIDWMAECERINRREWVAQEVRKVEDGGLADMGGDRAREWARVWDVAFDYDVGEMSGFTMDEAVEIRTRYIDRVEGMMPSLLSPEPEHWIPLQDGRVLIVNWRAGECVSEAISAAVWMDDGGMSLMGSYVLGSGWVSDDRLRDEDVDGEALGVILEAIARAGLAAVA